MLIALTTPWQYPRGVILTTSMLPTPYYRFETRRRPGSGRERPGCAGGRDRSSRRLRWLRGRSALFRVADRQPLPRSGRGRGGRVVPPDHPLRRAALAARDLLLRPDRPRRRAPAARPALDRRRR